MEIETYTMTSLFPCPPVGLQCFSSTHRRCQENRRGDHTMVVSVPSLGTMSYTVCRLVVLQVLAEVDSKYFTESGVDVCEYELRVSR